MLFPNPFQNEENLKPWFENFAGYKKAFQNSKQAYLQKISRTSQMTNPLQNLIRYFNTHLVAVALVAFVSLGSIGTLAAELSLPAEFKPSTVIKNLFAANAQPDIDPYTRLVYDGQNDVASLASCDLAIKYPKQIGTDKIQASSRQYGIDQEPIGFIPNQFYNNLQSTITIGNEGYSYEEYLKRPIENIEIECFNQPIADSAVLIKDYYLAKTTDIVNNGNNTTFQPKIKTTALDPDQLRQRYGWFVTESEITDIVESTYSREFQVYTDIAINDNLPNGLLEYDFVYKSPSQSVQYTYHSLSFNYQNKGYNLQFFTDNPYTKINGVDPNQIQIQFNSIVQNEANIILENPAQTKTSFKNASNYTLDTDPTCSLVPIKSYFGDKAGASIISVQNDLSSESKAKLTSFVNFLNGKEELTKSSDYGGDVQAFDLNPTQAIMASSCSGEAKFYIDDIQTNYPNTDLHRSIYGFSAQGVYPDISIYVYARNGQDLILLSTRILNTDIFDTKTNDLCAVNLNQPDPWQCYSEYLKNNPRLQQNIAQRAQRTIDEFSIVNK